jgi:hypothetical protein
MKNYSYYRPATNDEAIDILKHVGNITEHFLFTAFEDAFTITDDDPILFIFKGIKNGIKIVGTAWIFEGKVVIFNEKGLVITSKFIKELPEIDIKLRQIKMNF